MLALAHRERVEALAEVGDHHAAEATSRHRQAFGFTDAALHALAIGCARGGDLPRARLTIGRIQDAGPDDYKRKPRAWLHVGQALAESGRTGWAAEAFAEAVRGAPEAPVQPWLDVELLTQVAKGQHRLGRPGESAATLQRAVSRALADGDGRSYDLAEVAAVQTGLGLETEALATVGRIAEPKDRLWAWYGMVAAGAGADRLDEAYRLAERVEGDLVTRTWVALATVEAKRERRREPRRALEKVEAVVARLAADG
jgi:hypothetical protein